MIRGAKLQMTPITEETFKRQGWRRHLANDFETIDDVVENQNDEADDEDEGPFFFTLPIPKTRIDRYAPMFITNASDELEELKQMGLKPGNYFIELLDMDGLGFCTTEEELEILYKALTGNYIEE